MISELIRLYSDLYTQHVIHGTLRGVHHYDIYLDPIVYDALLRHFERLEPNIVSPGLNVLEYRVAAGILRFRPYPSTQPVPPEERYYSFHSINDIYELSGNDAIRDYEIVNGSSWSTDDIPF